MVNIGPDVAAAKRLMAQIQAGGNEKRNVTKSDAPTKANVGGIQYEGPRKDVMGVKDIPDYVWRSGANINVTINNIGKQENNTNTFTVTGGNNNIVTGGNNKQRIVNNDQDTTNNNTGWGWGPYYPPALPPVKPIDPIYLGPSLQVNGDTPPTQPDEPQLVGAPPLPQGKPYLATLNTTHDLAIVKDDPDEVVDEVAASADAG